MSKIYIKVLKPPSTTSPEDGLESADMVNKMVTFLISILKELRNSMTQGSCSLRVSFEFLSSVAPSLCIPSTKNSLEKQCTIVQNIIEDITRKKMRSVFYDRIVKTLSKVCMCACIFVCTNVTILFPLLPSSLPSFISKPSVLLYVSFLSLCSSSEVRTYGRLVGLGTEMTLVKNSTNY